MISTADFLKYELQNGIGFHNPLFINLAKETVNQCKDLPIKSVLDYGAGTGVYSDAFIKAGYEVVAYEIYKEHCNYIKEQAPQINLIDKPVTTDLLNFIETAEHMTDKELNKLFKTISPKYILFSSTSTKTPSFDEDWGHINIKTQNKWDIFFDTYGYKNIKQLTYPTAWSKLYQKI